MEILHECAVGVRVAELKKRLNALGYDCGEGDEFDRRTLWAVRWFCRQNGLTCADAVDEGIWRAIFDESAVRGVTD